MNEVSDVEVVAPAEVADAQPAPDTPTKMAEEIVGSPAAPISPSALEKSPEPVVDGLNISQNSLLSPPSFSLDIPSKPAFDPSVMDDLFETFSKDLNFDIEQLQSMTDEDLLNYYKKLEDKKLGRVTAVQETKDEAEETASVSSASSVFVFGNHTIAVPDVELQVQLKRKATDLARDEKEDEAILDRLNVQLVEISVNKDRLEAERMRLEEEGRFSEAQICLDKLRELNLVEGKKIETQMRQIFIRQKKRLAQRQSLEVDAFEAVWKSKLEEFETQAKEILLSSMERQQWEKKEVEKHLRSQLLVKRPKFSKQVLNMRAVMERLIKARQYQEAEQLKAKIRPLELLELEKFEHEQEVTLKNKMKFVESQSKQEIEALKKRIRQSKSELLNQRKIDWERLVQCHHNAMQELDLKNRKTLSKTSEYITKQSNVILSTPTKTMVDFSSISPRHLLSPSPRFMTSPRFVAAPGSPKNVTPKKLQFTSSPRTMKQ